LAYPGILPQHIPIRSWNLGNTINNPSQLFLARAGVDGFPIGDGQAIVAATGLFAPTIRHHKGTFYIVCTNVRKEEDRLNTQIFYITTRDIWSNQWSDPIYFDFEGIDPSLFFDEDDCAYIQGSYRAGPLGNPRCSIRQFEVDILTGKPLSETRTLWTGHLSQGGVKGPHIYKMATTIYFVAEGGTWQRHCITIARSLE
jgi:beta-xylosidase